MKDATKTLTRELEAAEANVGKFVSRPGTDYYTFGYRFDAGIAEKRDFAVTWRKWVLEVAAGRPLTTRTVKVYRAAVGGEEMAERTYRVYATEGKDLVAVFTRGSSNYIGRTLAMKDGETAEETLRREGWKC